METVLGLAKGVIVNSADSEKTLAWFAAEHDLPMPPTLVAPLGVAVDREDHRPDTSLPRLFFVTIGTIEGRKNHLMLLKVWERLAQLKGADTPTLVIIGHRGWSAANVFTMLDHNPVLKPHVIELADCADAMLRAYLANAVALLFPSFTEGQGLPLYEALALSTPAIASNLDVFREFAGEIPDYVDPTDEEGWLNAVLDYCDPANPRRSAQLGRMAGFQPPTWEDHFATVDAWLAQFAASNAG